MVDPRRSEPARAPLDHQSALQRSSDPGWLECEPSDRPRRRGQRPPETDRHGKSCLRPMQSIAVVAAASRQPRAVCGRAPYAVSTPTPLLCKVSSLSPAMRGLRAGIGSRHGPSLVPAGAVATKRTKRVPPVAHKSGGHGQVVRFGWIGPTRLGLLRDDEARRRLQDEGAVGAPGHFFRKERSRTKTASTSAVTIFGIDRSRRSRHYSGRSDPILRADPRSHAKAYRPASAAVPVRKRHAR